MTKFLILNYFPLFMANEPQKVQFSWADIMACMYCQHYITVGTHAASEFCQNKESPFYDSSAPRYGTNLTTAQAMGGCEKLLFNGHKLPPEIFKHVPSDSMLRRLPLQEVVSGYSADLDLSADKTVAELTGLQEEQSRKMLSILKSAGGPISLGELDRRMQPEE